MVVDACSSIDSMLGDTGKPISYAGNEIESPGSKNTLKKDWRKARKSSVPSTVSPDKVTSNIYFRKHIDPKKNQSLPGNSYFKYPTGYPHSC
jgi:hypothetical protein